MLIIWSFLCRQDQWACSACSSLFYWGTNPSPGKIISLLCLGKPKFIAMSIRLPLSYRSNILVKEPQADLYAISSLNLLVVGPEVNKSYFKVTLVIIMSDNYMKAPSTQWSFHKCSEGHYMPGIYYVSPGFYCNHLNSELLLLLLFIQSKPTFVFILVFSILMVFAKKCNL